MRKLWTPEEDQLMLKLFANTPTRDLAKMLGRSYSSVSGRSYLLGIHKSPEFMMTEHSGRISRLSKLGEEYRFKKGNVPSNKGRKWEEYMNADQIARCQTTTFKKGKVPHNTKHDGYTRVSVDGYLEVRTAKGKFEYVHRLLWQEHHGKIPKGMIVVFKDKNALNITIENLELIDRAENMRRNTIYRFPPEVVSTIKTLAKLKKTIYGKKQNK